jgi:hypothetical protein
MAQGAAQAGQIVGQTLQLPGQELGVFAVPHISWEAVITDTALDPATGQPVPVPRQWFPPFSSNDGEPARLTIPTKTLVLVEPLATAQALVASYRSGETPALSAFITLPFGLTANVDAFPDAAPPSPPMPTLDIVNASFPGFAAAMQARLAAAVPGIGSPALPGFSIINDSYAAGMLDTTPGDISGLWNGQFHGGFGTHFPPPRARADE